MAKRLDDSTAPNVQRAAGEVVVTMTPQRAQLVAASLWLGDADHTEWLDSLADSLSTASEEGDHPALPQSEEDAAAERSNVYAIGGAATSDPRRFVVTSDATAVASVRSDAQGARALTEALAVIDEPDSSAARDLETLADAAANVTKAAGVAAATNKLHAAEAAQADQAAGAAKVALATAETVRQAAHLVQLHAEQHADKIAEAAAEAALVVASAVLPGGEAVGIEKAAEVADIIRATAADGVRDTAAAAATVASAAATAASDAAAHAADAAAALERQVVDTEAAVQAAGEEPLVQNAAEALQRLRRT